MRDRDDIIDSQVLAEHVGFLENCFDNSFARQNTLLAVKEYVADELKEKTYEKKAETIIKKLNSSINKTTALETSTLKVPSQGLKQGIVNKKLKNWGLPAEIAWKYEQRGITEMFDWQVTCLANSKVLIDCCNLVYSAPTSAGKTLVAEILTIKTILERQKKVIIILPFVSIVREKMIYLQDILSSSGIRVEGFMGSQSPPGGLQAVHVAICTIEKANSLVNRLLDDGNISELGAVIVDELHLLGDPHRGYILELLLTKIKYVSSKSADVLIQIVGMSATLPNLEDLANWLSAELFITQFRPIPLDELCLVGSKMYNKDGTCVSSLNISKNANESDSILNFCLETIKECCSILIFCMTKNRCENLAQSISSSFYNLGCQQCESGSMLRNQLKTENISEVLEQLKNCPVGLDEILKKTISFGVAYHHAGLTFDERDIIEGAFKSGAIRVLVATSTLSSGVNLPARKVIIRSPVFMREPINILTYKQMIGRAGRMGKDTKGESILICTENEKKIGFELMMGALDPVKSCIETADKYMRAVLEIIASQVVCTKSELDLYSKCTLLFTQQNLPPSQNKLLENTLAELKNYELVRVQNDGEESQYVATPLGKACLSASMAPNDGLSLFLELQKARQCLVLETDLHLIYLVTPYSVSCQWGDIDWLHLLTLWESLTKAMKRVGELVGVQESFIIRCLRGTNKLLSNAQNKLDVHKRFYTALALQDLVNEVPLSEVAVKFRCARGFLQSLQQAAATFAGMVTAFCRQLGWKNMEILISQFQDRLHFGINSELLELMKLPSLNGVRARALFDSGYETVSSIASADVNVIENVLHKAVPFQSEKQREDDDSSDLKRRNKIKTIWITGYCGMTPKESAKNLIIEARKHLENEIGVAEIKWNTNVYISNMANPTKDLIIAENNSHDNVITDCIATTVNAKGTNIIEHELNKKVDDSVIISRSISEFETQTSKPRMSLDLLDISAEDVYISANLCNLNVAENCVKEENYATAFESSRICDKFQNKIAVSANTSTIKTEVVTCSTPVVESNSSDKTKDGIVWDSLNFTEGVIENITKIRISEKEFSPNISFGDSVKSSASLNNIDKKENPNATSVKDISLFSSEGDNSSFFEESLDVNLLPSKLLGSINMSDVSTKQETTADFVNINSNSILDVFKSPIVETDEDEDMKLLNEGDEVDIETDKILVRLNLNLSTDNEVDCSQENISAISDLKSPYNKRKIKDTPESVSHQAKKAKKPKRIQEALGLIKYTLEAHNINLENVIFDTKSILIPPLQLSGQAKTIPIYVNNNVLRCVLLRCDDVYHFLCIVQKLKIAHIYLKFKQKNANTKTIIGSDILNVAVQKSDNYLFLGMGFYLMNGTCIFLDHNSLVNEKDKNLMTTLLENDLTLIMYSLKTNYLQLKKWLGISLPSTSIDVCLTDWLLDSDEKIPTIESLMKKYVDIDLSTASIKIDGKRTTFKNIDLYADVCIKAWCVGMISERQKTTLRKEHIIAQNIIDNENKVATILADCELHGITVDRALASQMLVTVRRLQDALQKTANKLAGCQVHLNSPLSVAKVLGMYRGGKVSTNKTVLMCHNSPLSSVVIFWRKLNSILTKTLFPLTEKAHINSEGNKIYPTYTMHTCTGRISMHEPNLQNVPRTFSIPSELLELGPGASRNVAIEFNCRNIFRASEGCVMVSADYCQLEMRILTHFSGDHVLMGIMRSNVDVFKSIASSWSGVPEEEVDEDLRHKAKQLCYGILYGMGNKTLALHLDVTEMEAAYFMDSFYKTFPLVKQYTQKVIEECRVNGYVETLMRRRRYLPGIKSNILAKRGAAERQAVNTTIQGSAADIAKAAMCAIEERTVSFEHKPQLLLQMHDELIYEVPEKNRQVFATMLKEIMEGTVKLNVPLPVKLKSGYTWGTLEEIRHN